MGRVIRARASVSALLAMSLSMGMSTMTIAIPRECVAAPAEDEAKAKALFEEARVLAKAEKWAEACEKLAASKRLVPKMLTTYRLADCQEHVGQLASAHAGYLEAAELAKAVGDTDKLQDALLHAKLLEGKLSRVAFEIPASDVALSFKLDGATLAPVLALEKLPLDPGEHTLVVGAEGKKPRTVTFTVPPGPALTSVKIAPLEAAAGDPKLAPDVVVPIDDPKTGTSSGSSLRTAGFVTGAIGVVGLGVGVVLGLSARSLDRSADCTDKGCTPDGKKTNDDARSRGNLASIIFGVGAVAATAGLVMILVAPSKSTEPERPTASLSPWASVEGGGVRLFGSF